MNRSYDQQCPIARVLDLVGDRWTLLIIRDLFLGRTKFKEFLERSPGMPTRMLSERLKGLEGHGIVERTIYSTHPLRAEYHLTDLGRSLRPVIEAIVAWGIEHTFEPDERAAVVEKIARLSADARGA
ncbi:MAG TPA: helix-turn-helix domain-containing protein [Dehalococcoidia bacterium]|nr:helix-turn-helix domain-containing protein [Dehalococcoidia bacterium]